ncbi:MAG TPA: inorganic phosphate transporter [Longimicrobiales bacterium]|nr:inorganic phosphate transporter [Longimicrobiales bacterium]
MELVVVLALATGLYMAWTIGANDVANAMGTSVGSGALTLRRAIIVAGIFEFGGAVLVGTHVTETIRKGILDPTFYAPAGTFGADGPLILALGMTAALLGAAIWLQAATLVGLPVSTTHSIVGAVVGFGLVSVGVSGIDWTTLGSIVASWVVSPALGGILGFLAFVVVRRLVLRSDDPVDATRRVVPYIVGVVGFILALTFVYKALSNVLPDPHPVVTGLAAALVGGVSILVFRGLVTRYGPGRVRGEPMAYVEGVFGWLQIVTAAFVAFAHGANDVANAVGPLAAVVGIASVGFREVPATIPVSGWLLAAGGVGIVIGLATWGYKVIATIGKRITEITPTRGFAAEFGAACTVLIASRLGLPVSTTHVLVGAVVGVGFAQGLGALNLRTVRDIAYSWIATVPAAAALGALLFAGLRLVFV